MLSGWTIWKFGWWPDLLNVRGNSTTASAKNENELLLLKASLSTWAFLSHLSLPPLSSSQEALVMVKTWSVPIKWKITPGYIPFMHPLHTEPFHQECWNTEREEAVELHLNRHHNQRPDWRPALYPTLALSVCMAHASPSGTSNRPSLLKAMSLFNANMCS